MTPQHFSLDGLLTATASHVGRVRAVNQDACGDFDDDSNGRHLLFVADGMGGHRAGEVASQYAVEAVGRVFGDSQEPAGRLLENAFEAANTTIYESARKNGELAGMGTTGVALLLDDRSESLIAHVGDSRAYRMRGGRLQQLTGDHSVVGELVRRGQLSAEEARVHPQNNEILRALGTQDQVDVELTSVDVRPGDVFLLCSDGLSGMLPDPEIEAALRDGLANHDDDSSDGPQAALERTVERLIELANEAGGNDNISVQIAVVGTSAPGTTSRTHSIHNSIHNSMNKSKHNPQPLAERSGLHFALVISFALGLGLLFIYCFGGSDPRG